MNMIWEVSLPEFIFITIILGGSAAWMSGRAIAGSWQPFWIAALWMLLLGAAVRFIHFALFSGSLLTLHYYVVDTVILIAIAALGHRATRARRTAQQYSWLYEKTSPFTWRRKPAGGTPSP
ncbi:hypothetical protein GCM10007276_19110 [Agaricicola taiwanensis]|uniref:DUF6867 domain-containing protein n=1 Tax=Agaricicola taiwanensis TaxID=591372 RepID=A0A8J2VWT3_9RHOB|nr:hypothetical protein [Agaricicola taiwanensis]GGE41959.1 hypothetical protein GCM10007276_19110 [Agaricicola taiwanensis]